jgi:hypothetical protein
LRRSERRFGPLATFRNAEKRRAFLPSLAWKKIDLDQRICVSAGVICF